MHYVRTYVCMHHFTTHIWALICPHLGINIRNPNGPDNTGDKRQGKETAGAVDGTCHETRLKAPALKALALKALALKALALKALA